MALKIETAGLHDEDRRLSNAIHATPEQFKKAMGIAIAVIEKHTKREAPVGKKFGGTLRQKISSMVLGHYLAVLTGGTKYTRIQDKGGKTKAHRIEPRFAKMLAWGVSPGSPFANAMRFGSGKVRGTSMRNVNMARSRMQSGASVMGMYFHWPKGAGVNHPGSRIKAQNFSARGFERSKQDVYNAFKFTAKKIAEKK